MKNAMLVYNMVLLGGLTFRFSMVIVVTPLRDFIDQFRFLS